MSALHTICHLPGMVDSTSSGLYSKRLSSRLPMTSNKSKRTYGAGIRRWMTFVKLFGTETFFMRPIPPEFSRYQTEVGAFNHTSWQQACFMGFLEWLQSPPSFRHQLSICSEASSCMPWSRYDQSGLVNRSLQVEEGEHEHLLDR